MLKMTARAAWHLAGASIVAGYLLAAIAVVIARSAGAGLAFPGLVAGWLPLHLLLLGAATNAVFIWSRHFAQALLHTPPGPELMARLRIGMLNAGVILVLTGVTADWPAVAVTGAAAVIAAVAAHTAALVAMARTNTLLAGILRVVAWYYVAAGVALAGGAAIGAVLAAGVSARSAALDTGLMLAHAHLNLLGWLAMPIAGTGFMLWPTVLRTRMSPEAPRIARRVLPLLIGGLAVTATVLIGSPYLPAGPAAAAPWLAATGVGVFTAGLAWSLVPAVQEMRAAPPHSGAAWMLLAGNAWLVIALAADIIGLAIGLPFAQQWLERALIPVFAAGAIGQILIGALSYLLPVTIGGGPASGKAMAHVLGYAWRTRLMTVNLGVLALLATPPGTSWRAVAWVAILAGLGTFPLLAVAGIVTARRSRAAAAGRPRPGPC